MNRKPELPLEIGKEIDASLDRVRELYREDRIEESINALMEGWELIPEPKEKWDFYPQVIVTGFVSRYVTLNDLENTKKWLNVTYKMYGDEARESQYVLMMEGESLLELGEKDKAYEVFERIYKLHGKDGFYGEQVEHLVFLLKERAARNEE